MISPKDKKEEFAKAVCMFLAEQLQVKKIGLKRGAEIAQKVVANLNLLDEEKDFLSLIKELSKDFEELAHLEKHILMHMKHSERVNMENNVRDFVINVLHHDAQLALQVMQEAIKDEIKEQHLMQRFPEYKLFMEKKNGFARNA